MLISVIGVSDLGHVTGLAVDDQRGLLRAVGAEADEHILLLAPLHLVRDAREQAHVLLAANRAARARAATRWCGSRWASSSATRSR